MNLADQVFYDIYSLLNDAVLVAFIRIINEWKPALYLITVIAVTIVGYKQIYSNKPDTMNFFKSLAVIVIFYLFIVQSDRLYEGVKYVFIDFPVAAGDLTISGLKQGLASLSWGDGEDVRDQFAQTDLSFEPDGSSTAFGALWDFSTLIADNVLSQGKWNNPMPYIVGGLLYVVALALLMVQIVLMATGLILATVAILGTPFFAWMLLFKPLKPMFEKWLTLGIGAGVLLYFLIVLLGVILAFMGKGVYESTGYNVFSPDVDLVNDPDWEFDMGQLASTVLFSLIGIKMIPKAETWSSSVAGMAIGALSEATEAIGTGIAGMLGTTANKATKPIQNKTKEIGSKTAQSGKDILQGVRDRMMQKRMNEDDPKSSENMRKQAILDEKNTDKTTSTTDATFSQSDSSGRSETVVNGDEFTDRESLSHKETISNNEPSNSTDVATNRDSVVNQNINQNNSFESKETNEDIDNNNDSLEQIGSKERQETHLQREKVLDKGSDSNSNSEKERASATMISNIQKDKELANSRMQKVMNEVRQSSMSKSEGQTSLEAAHQAEIQRVSDKYSGSELARLKKNIDKEFAKLNESFDAANNQKSSKPKVGQRQESKELKDE